MALRKRAPGLICLLLVTAALLLAGRPSSAAPISGTEDRDDPQTLEEDSLQYREPSTVRIISLQDLPSADTAAERVLAGEWTGLRTAEAAEMAEILAELSLNDGTCIRLYATAEGLVHGAFLRPGGVWTCFAQFGGGAEDGDAAAEDLTLTSFSGILGKEGFLLRRTVPGLDGPIYDYCWFDGAGALQVLRAWSDPAALDLDGDGAAELAWGFAGRQSGTVIYCRDAGGALYQVTPDTYMDGSHALLAVEREGPGPIRLIYRCEELGRETFCAVTLESGRLRVEKNIVYVPAETEAVPLPADPTENGAVTARLSVTGPDGQGAEDAGDAAAREFRSMLWEGGRVRAEGAVLVPTDAPLDESAAYTVTFTPETGEPLSWTLDDQGVCRFTGLEGSYRMLSTGLGSLPEWCWDTMALWCAAARTAGD